METLKQVLRSKPFRFTCALILVSMWSAAARADALFYSVSGDPNNFFVPDILSSIDATAQTVNDVGPMGGGDLGFNGGLTVAGGSLYSIANDSLGNSSFYSIQPNGSISLIGSAGGLGQGFLGGLTYDPQNSFFYAAVLDNEGNTTLYSISQTGNATSLGLSLGTGFSGLAFDSANNLFYGIENDSNNFSTLVDFGLSGPVNPVGALGFGFDALTYDKTNNFFWALAQQSDGSSILHQITSIGQESNGLMTLPADGFVELAVQSPAGPTTPEPATEVELGGGLCLLAIFLKRRTGLQQRRKQ